MTNTEYNPKKLTNKFTTKSGRPLRIGTGTGTKWKGLKQQAKENGKGTIQELIDQLLLALKNGYYHIDAAEFYTTHPEIGVAWKQSGVEREDLWITSKYHPGYGNIEAFSKGPLASVDKALKELGTDYLDLFLIHLPFFTEDISQGYTIETAWKEMVKAKTQGKVRHIGVSNFSVAHLERVFKICDPESYPEVNQVEFHPYLQNQTEGITEFCQKHSIFLEAYAPLTPLFRVDKNGTEVTHHPLQKLLPELSQKYDKSDSQILLRYTLQKGYLPITTSAKLERIQQSLAVYNFELAPEDVTLIDKTGSTFSFQTFFESDFNALNA